MDLYVYLWLAAGAIMIISELFAPGLIIVFLGASAITVAMLRATGILHSHAAEFFAFGVISLVYTMSFRSLLKKYFPSEKYYNWQDEDLEAHGQVVPVVTTVDSETSSGRIKYNGTSWPAKTLEGTINAGAEARILHRDNIGWLIEKV